jgi:hypothetical protein
MALILKDRVKETSSSSGTGNITLGGAFPGYQTFNAAIATGSTVYYTIHNLAAGFDTEWEVGVGTFTSPATLSRDTVFSSSTGSKINFTAGAGGLEVFITQPAGEAVYINDATGRVEAFGNGANTIAFTNINTTNLTASTVTVTAGTITTNAANATDITNKTYVDGLFSTGISYHEPVLVESTASLTAVYVQPNGAGNGVGATLTNSGANAAIVIDGVTLSNTARVLVDNQANAVQNGVYTVTNPGNATAQWVLTRATDANTFGLANPNTLGQGDAFFVSSGGNGAGRTYICNTTGTITFGSTNITFAQISSAQIYAAGTGLNLSNLTFSISNTAVTAAQYGNDGAVGQFTVNAQGQITNAANVSINASSISVGTLANGRTTAASANGASTIVLRDSNGSFAGNVITATTSNATTFNGTTGNFTNITGNAVALTAINASNVTSGTLANARTTASDANSASTIVVRDANGAFAAGNVTAANFIGAGTTITSINASNISSGTIANARTTAASANGANTIVARDASGDFEVDGITANWFTGNGANISAINASNVSTGTIANARTTAATANGASTIVLRGASGEFAAGAITGTSFTGNGSALTAINASAITTGTLDNARTSAASANGASTIVVRDANGSFAGNVGTFTTVSGAGSGLTSINASNISSGTIANVRTTADSANGANTIVLRDASGDFSVDGITANWLTGNGANLSAINASNVSSGTVATARLATGTANSSTYLRGDSTWAAVSGGTVIPAGTVMIFAQNLAPTGFTKNVSTGDNHALRVTTGTASTGGSVGFTTAFASQAVNGTIANTTAGGSVSITSVTGTAGATTLSTPQIPSHNHTITMYGGPASPNKPANVLGEGPASGTWTTNNTGGGGSHDHPFSFSSGSGSFTGTAHNHTFTGTAINLAVQYIDVIRATKD